MSDQSRKTIIDRANRMLRQSQILRKMSDELLKESRDIRESVKTLTKKATKRR